MSAIAKSGFAAEAAFATDGFLLKCVETAFNKKIVNVKSVPHGKKTDRAFEFEDGVVRKFQIKNGNNERGFHVHREPLETLPLNDGQKQLLRAVCLKSGEPRVQVENSLAFLTRSILGEDPEWTPDYVVHLDGTRKIQLCPIDAFMKTLRDSMYPEMVAKRTCVHLNPYVYLQRRGGEKHDRRPNDIQTKVRLHILLKRPDMFLNVTLPSE